MLTARCLVLKRFRSAIAKVRHRMPNPNPNPSYGGPSLWRAGITQTTDARGKLLEQLMDDHNMVALNTGAGTYIRQTGELSHLDVAMATTNIARVANWIVTNETIGSDHLLVKIIKIVASKK